MGQQISMRVQRYDAHSEELLQHKATALLAAQLQRTLQGVLLARVDAQHRLLADVAVGIAQRHPLAADLHFQLDCLTMPQVEVSAPPKSG